MYSISRQAHSPISASWDHSAWRMAGYIRMAAEFQKLGSARNLFVFMFMLSTLHLRTFFPFTRLVQIALFIQV